MQCKLMSSSSKIPRVVRKHDAKQSFTESTYRKKAFPKLMDDFEKRCAYSMVHVSVTSETNMEVDHFNSTLAGKKRHTYSNLYPASSVCNGAKRDVWPTKNDLKKRRRFLDCCIETDYGVHFFEDKATGELLPVTAEGVYHIENCDLNNDWLKQRRLERTENKKILAALNDAAASPIGPTKQNSQDLISVMEERIKIGIPKIPALPPGSVPL